MFEDVLTWFFNENGIDREKAPPAAALEHNQIQLQLAGISLEEVIKDSILERLPEREKEVQAEKREIESAETCKRMLHLMRRGTDIMNQQLLVRRALEFEDEIIPEIILMLKTSLNDLFIEVSIRVLAICGKDISEELTGMYDQVRSPYARSMILVALGFKANEKSIPWLIKKYNELKRLYPDESYCYGAYYALYEMESRFYSDKRSISSSPGAN